MQYKIHHEAKLENGVQVLLDTRVTDENGVRALIRQINEGATSVKGAGDTIEYVDEVEVTSSSRMKVFGTLIWKELE